MKTIIQAAVESGRPPLELLLDEPGRKRSKWDGKLIKAYFYEKSTDLEGHPIWVEESPDVVFSARRRKIRSLAVVEKAQEDHGKKKNPEKGVRFYAEAVLAPGAQWPTREAWMKKNRESPDDYATDDAKAQERIDSAEARAAERVANDPDLMRIVAEAEAKIKLASDRQGK